MIIVRFRPYPGAKIQRVEIDESKDPFEVLAACIQRIDAMAASSTAPQAPCTARSDSPEVPVATPPASTPASAHSAPPGKSTGGEHRLPAQPAATGPRDTSMIAYRALELSGRMTRQQKKVMEFFAANPQRTYTRQELAQALELPINSICGRVNELMRAPFEVLEEGPRRRCRMTGESSHPLRVKIAQKAAA